MHTHRENEWLEFDLLRPYTQVKQALFTRCLGTSRGPFSSLNISLDVGDTPADVHKNREKIRTTLGIKTLTFMKQVHGIDIVKIDAKNAHTLFQADALFTQEPDIGLVVAHADCQAALFYDPKQHVIAIAHSGWRGSVQNIYARVIERLALECHTRAEDLIVGISPSLGPCHAQFTNRDHELPRAFDFAEVKPFYYDFWQISLRQLTSMGVLDRNIEIAEICTYCHEESFYSYRRDGQTGRNAAVIALGIIT